MHKYPPGGEPAQVYHIKSKTWLKVICWGETYVVLANWKGECWVVPVEHIDPVNYILGE